MSDKSIHELQNCIEELLATLAAERKFREEFGEWLEHAKSDACTARMNWMKYSEEIDVGLEGALAQWNELEAKRQNKSAADKPR